MHRSHIVRLLGAALLMGSVGLAMDSPSLAQGNGPPERSGATYHKPVCPGPAAANTARCHAHVVTDNLGQIISRDASPNIAPSGFGPAQLRDAYKITGSGSGAITIAIVDAYGYNNAEADLGVYRSQFGLPACTTANGCFRKVNQNGAANHYPRQNTGWAQETALDLDMVSAMCPNCHILLVQADSNSFLDLATAVDTAASMGAHAISNSYGGTESSSSQTFEGSYNHAGVAITVSSGDSGYGVQFPASSPHVTAVGGTHLVVAGNSRGWSESVWSGAGSGCSTVYSKPAWQTDVSCSKRMEADVSAVADPNTGVAVYGPVNPKSSAWQVYGGTSVAAPLIAGVYGVNGGAVNYGSDPYAHTGALFDVTSGSNGSCGGTYLCTGKVGYDGPTGLGTPNGDAAF